MKYGIVFLLLIGVGTILYLSGGSNDPYAKKNAEVDEIRWEKDYDSQSNHPYGTYFLHELINRGFKGYDLHNLNHSVQDYFDYDSLKVQSEVANYFFIGKNLNLYNGEIDSLLAFAKRGNNIFIAAEFFPKKLLRSLISHDYQEFIREESDTVITLKFFDRQFADQEYELTNVINDVNIERRWRLWSSGAYSDFYKKNIGNSVKAKQIINYASKEIEVMENTKHGVEDFKNEPFFIVDFYPTFEHGYTYISQV